MSAEPETNAMTGSEPDPDRTRPVTDPSATGRQADATGTPPGRTEQAQPDDDQAPTRRRVTVQEAADVLGISVEAVRARTKRGTLRKEKAPDGTVYVWLEADQTRPGGDQTMGQPSIDDDQTDREERPGGDRAQPDQELEPAFVDALRDHIALLRSELEDRKEESRRKDAIILSLSQRIPELEAPAEPRDSPEKAAEGAGEGSAPPDAQEPAQRRSWLYRFFFGP